MKVNIHIERLVLDGVYVSANQLSRMQAALKTELGRLLADDTTTLHRLSSNPGHVDQPAHSVYPASPTNEVHWAEGGDVADLGRQIAGAVYSGGLS